MGNRSVGLLGVIGVAVCVAWVSGTPSMHAQTVATRDDDAAMRSSITLDATAVRLEDALRELAKQAKLRLVLPADGVSASQRVTVHVRGMSAEAAFARVLEGTGLRAAIGSGYVIVKGVVPAPVAQGSISGRVIDGKSKQGLRGATVSINGTGTQGAQLGTTTSDDGSFRFSSIVPGSYSIHVRMLGYTRTTRTVTVVEGQTAAVEIVLEPSANALDQIVVTGTVAATAQREVPNAMTIITAKDIEQRGITRIDQLFRGDVPGLFVANQGTGSALDEAVMFSRGATSLVGGITPIKTYVDGVELVDPKYLSSIDPKSIERVEIVTGPQASTVYGSNAINGVMQVFTKRGAADAHRPRLSATLLSGWVQNNFRSTLTPQHDYSAQASGTEGRWSYNAGGSWVYLGPWSPARQTTRTNGFGGVRFQMPTPAGMITMDASLRLNTTANRATGGAIASLTALRERGIYNLIYNNGGLSPTTSTLDGQTLGLSMTYAPWSWWTHEATLGTDASTVTALVTEAPHANPVDSLVQMYQSDATRTSVRYTTTARIPMSPAAQLVLVAGGDAWQSMQTTLNTRSLTLTGTLAAAGGPTRIPSHNRGAFVQGQLGFWDALFVTYGARAEWNPNYGENAQPNVAPRYGVAYTRDVETPVGALTAKLRGSYGRATRPPQAKMKSVISILDYPSAGSTVQYYGVFDMQLASPDLGPEYQKGGEGGLELYLGNRASLVVTRYNQTVDDLIAMPYVDSVPTLDITLVDIFGYYGQGQYLNIGSVRNQGWELQGTLQLGPFSTRGTYSWTKSRVIGLTPKYQQVQQGLIGEYTPGASLGYLPEHTWALAITYAHAATTMSINFNGTGYLTRQSDELRDHISFTRLGVARMRVALPLTYLRFVGPGYTMADLNATHRFSTMIEGILQVQNLTDFYRSDYGSWYATIGRQTKAGFRVRL